MRAIESVHCFRPLLKWINSDFSGPNAIPRVLAHCRQVFQAFSSCWVLAAAFFPKASRFVSSAKPTILTSGWSCFRALYSEQVQKHLNTTPYHSLDPVQREGVSKVAGDDKF